MTTDRDFDRLARAWLELGPDEAPERTVTAILQATETLPQVRRRFRWPAWRDLTMSRSPLFIGVWATVLIAVAGIALLTRPDQHNNAGTPTSPPSSAASRPPASAVAAGTLDPRLVGQWMGDNRPIQEIPLMGGTRLIFTDFGASYLTPANSPVDNYLTSSATATAGTMRLVTGTDLNSDCTKGDVGIYTWSLSPSDRVLRIDASQDDCIPRIASIVGSWWRIGCHDVTDGCLGDLDAGAYRSAFTTFHEAPPNQFPVLYGNLTYAVPDGWANSGDWDSGLELEPSNVYADLAGERPYQKIQVVAHPAIAAQDASCSPSDQPGVQPTAAAMIHAITQLPSVTASAPTQISINLLRGQMVDLSLAPSWSGICPAMGGTRSAPLLHQAGSGDQGWAWRVSAPERWRLIVLDLGGGNLAAIALIDSGTQGSFNELAAEAMPIVRSMRFK